MKVLFAVNNDNISEAVVKKYQKEYKEIISYKNVYYFNAILKELQNNKVYDCVVISEDLEPFANNNYDTIDKFLFEKLERIKEEATKANGSEIEVVLICADRRSESDEMLNKLFGIKIYNALIGDDRNIDTLCRLMNTPRTKKEAKLAYKIESNNGMYQTDDENGVSELEVQNILAHYKRLGKNGDKYVDSFNNIVSQYTDAQLRIIIRYLPLHVKAVLEEQSPKYQELSTFATRSARREEPYTSRTSKTVRRDVDIKMLKSEKEQINKPIVIPSEINNKNIVKIKQKEIKDEQVQFEEIETNIVEEDITTPKRGRGRPRKNSVQEIQEDKPKRGRGRPKKETFVEEQEEDFDIDLFGLNEVDTTVTKHQVDLADEGSLNIDGDIDFDLFNMDNEEPEEESEENLDELDLFNMEDDDSEDAETDDVDLFSMDDQEELETEELEDEYIEEDDSIEEEYAIEDFGEDGLDDNVDKNIYDYEEPTLPKEENKYVEPTIKSEIPLNTLLTNEKKIVSFVGTTKNGTSFIVNNLALTLSGMNISTAILDMTQNKNSYYIFTNNEERLRRIAENSIDKLERGIAEGIKVNKNLTVYTEVPGTGKKHENVENILVSLMKNHDVVLIDTDFNTDAQVFDKSQELYLVQSMDVLTIQPLTAFLRNLKTKGFLRQEKIKIIINKEQKLRTLTDSLLIGGMSSYNDPSMTLMTELFNKDNVRYCKIPFEVQNYVKYLDSVVNCEIYLRGYTKQLLGALNGLAETVYPLLNKNRYEVKSSKRNRMEFSDATRNTLDKMKRNY